MLQEILMNIPFLFILIIANILTGAYYNIKKLKDDFSWSKLFDGLIKGGIIAFGFFATAITCDRVVDLSGIVQLEQTPTYVMLLGIGTYLAKVIADLARILVPNNIPKVEEIVQPTNNGGEDNAEQSN